MFGVRLDLYIIEQRKHNDVHSNFTTGDSSPTTIGLAFLVAVANAGKGVRQSSHSEVAVYRVLRILVLRRLHAQFTSQ
jgi:hypothetical protein